MADKASIVICGGGILGLTIARELLLKGFGDIVILEKETEIGRHASGRNSGILHAGIYYSPDSLKARFCLVGNLLMKDYCRAKHVPLSESGKVIVARDADDLPTLAELYNRALKNGAAVELIDAKQLKGLEPNAKTFQQALYSPQTAVVDPKKVLAAIENDLISSNKVRILRGMECKEVIDDNTIRTERGDIQFGLFLNAAGAHSDKVAHLFGVGGQFRIIPFKGTYSRLKKERDHLVRGNIYPVPDILNPFLGVHFTRSIDGAVYIGPTAISAFGRENYGIIDGMDGEAPKIAYRNLVLLLRDPSYGRTACREMRKYVPKFFFDDAKNLVESLKLSDIERSSKVGIRAQLVDWDTKRLVMDFVVLRTGSSLHILNAISPGFTCSMAFAGYIVNRIISGA